MITKHNVKCPNIVFTASYPTLTAYATVYL